MANGASAFGDGIQQIESGERELDHSGITLRRLSAFAYADSCVEQIEPRVEENLAQASASPRHARRTKSATRPYTAVCQAELSVKNAARICC
jgi:hypothetical protein